MSHSSIQEEAFQTTLHHYGLAKLAVSPRWVEERIARAVPKITQSGADIGVQNLRLGRFQMRMDQARGRIQNAGAHALSQAGYDASKHMGDPTGNAAVEHIVAPYIEQLHKREWAKGLAQDAEKAGRGVENQYAVTHGRPITLNGYEPKFHTGLRPPPPAPPPEGLRRLIPTMTNLRALWSGSRGE